jgi:hypothetical protein
MEITIVALLFLTLILFSFIFFKNKKSKIQIQINRQSDTHLMLKQFFSRNIEQPEKISQVHNRINSNSINVLVVDSQAYWISNNTFFTAETINNVPNMDTAHPVDIFKMSKQELDKMLFILDNLGGGKNNERGSTGN